MSNLINLLLIDFNTPDKQFIINNLLPNTKYIEINSLVESYSEIQQKIQQLNEQRFNNVSIIRVNDKQFFKLPIYNVTSIDSEELSKEESNNFRDFLLNLKNQYEMQYFDVITCNAYDTHWQQFITAFKNNYDLHIRTSANVTGLGGDWILESDNINLVGLYFNENIVNYKYSLDLGQHTVVVDSSFNLFSCGWNIYGELGTGNNTDSNVLVDMLRSNISGKIPIQVARGENYTLILMSDRTIYGCGYNIIGQLGTGNSNNSNILIPMIIPIDKTPIQVACGYYHTVVLMSDGTIYSCGYNNVGQLGTGNNTSSNVLVDMSSVPSGKTPIQIACGGFYTVVLMSDGTIYACGRNLFGQFGNNNTINSNILVSMTSIPSNKIPIQISCGLEHTIVLMSDGSIYSCGYNNVGQLGTGNNNSSANLISMSSIPNDKIPIQIDCGIQHTIVLMSDRTIYTCGANDVGQLGIGNNNNSNVLISIDATNISGKIPIQVACGDYHTIVLMTDGSIYGSGYNSAGQIGMGNNTNYYTLTQLNTTKDIYFVKKIIKPLITNLDASFIFTSTQKTISITGRYFVFNPTVKVDGSLVASTLVSSTQITFDISSNISKNSLVTVSNNYGTSNSYQITYIDPPSISYLDISLVSTLGGQTITINGSNFNYNPVVNIDGSLVTSTFISSTQITFVTPVNTSGFKSLTVTNDYGTSNSYQITYVNPPSIINLDVSLVSTLGGKTVTIDGSDFNYNPVLKIDGSSVAFTPVFTPANLIFSDGSERIIRGTTRYLDPYYSYIPGTGYWITDNAFAYNQYYYENWVVSYFYSDNTVKTSTNYNFTTLPTEQQILDAVANQPSYSWSGNLQSYSKKLTFVTPVNTSGTKSLTVSNDFGTSNLFNITYITPPSISYLDISFVLTLGGQTITINGSDFNYNPVVKIDGALVNSTLVSSTQITFVTPTNNSRIKYVTVSNSFGSSNSYQITYGNIPSISYLDISLVSFLGGQTVTINGSDFNYNPVVNIDGSLVASTLVSPNQITFVTPVNTFGIKSVAVTNNFGSSNLFNITYVNPPAISYLDISIVSFLGGQTVTINGSDFNYEPIVKIDGSLVSSTLISSTQIIFVTPIKTSGTKYVTVSNDYGSSNSVSLEYIVEPISNICFLAGTPIQCDQGTISIEKINPDIHTIRGNKIETITKTISLDKYLVCIEKNAFSKNIPSQKTLISKNHTLLYGKKIVKAKELLELNNQKIHKANYNGEVLYNILLQDIHDVMIVNNLVCETLDPNSGIAKMYFYIKNSNYTFEQKNNLIKKYNDNVIKEKAFI
jgi:alpha-tubulin suppressor-like RCC1 family protein